MHCHAHRCASASYNTAADLYSMVYELRQHFKAIMEVLYCFAAAIGLPSDASDCNEDKRSAVAVRMQNKVVVE